MPAHQSHALPAGEYPLLIKQLLLTPLAQAPDQEIVYRDVIRYSYRTLRERIGRLASALARLGVQHGDTVAILDWDSHRYLECFFGVPMMGSTLQTVNVRLSAQQILFTLAQAEPKVLLVHEDFRPVIEDMLAQLPSVRHVVRLSDDAEPSGTDYESLLASADAHYPFADFDENTRATLFYTSGTTGMPKGVYYSHRQLVLHTLAVAAAFAMPRDQGRFHRGDVYMPITPMFHVHAWGMPYVATMMGVKQVYPGRYTPDGLLALRTREGVTFSHCVPTILRMLLDQADASHTDLSGWKVVVGGASFPSSLARSALGKGMDVFAGYGMSETCPFIVSAQVETDQALCDAEPILSARVAAGRALPLVDVQIVDDQMTPIAQGSGRPGEVVLRAPWLTPGYFRNESASAELWRGGYLHTGDIGTLDHSGYLRITDRLKDVIKTGGEWLSSYKLEELICRHPHVKEAAVIGLPDPRWGERPAALVVADPTVSPALDERAVRGHLHTFVDAGEIPKYAVPEKIYFVESLARTSVGKYNKKLMRDQYLTVVEARHGETGA
ncbi:fatty acid--CoA ligase [Achromobacter sp. MFA1 R4]|uniref:fatty acid--CoA ligase n=1 Tax=Achromobacter sp. MFA1 R4 TaxID=1881016 RepID=UPI000953961B|nr:fatty acid--CoA ligase [Achromobacter sp. MFA1 R4]SIT17859.1 fatty-acyl-CoA synthase [Achromobacter sp. MFA1 R4]